MILGHERQIKYLEKVLQNGRFAHAYLFSGPEGVGKFTIAKTIAQSFYCNQMSQVHSDRRLAATFGQVCNTCSDCVLIERGVHPQVVILDLEQTLVSKKDKRKEIPIEDIRELKRRLVFAPALNQWRVVIINQTDKMSKEAEAAFLKLLEEPGSQVLFILLSAFKDNISSTIISRAQVINFSLLPAKVLADFIGSKIKDADLIREILLLARGRAGVMFKLLEDKKSLDEERKFFKEIGAVLEKKDLAGAFHLSEKVAGDDILRQKVSDYLILALRERLNCSKSDFKQFEAIRLVQGLKKIHRISQVMETTNVNPRLALDVMFLEALKEFRTKNLEFSDNTKF